MRAMFDSVTPARLPSNATMVACYRDGSFANEAEVRHRFPHATVVTITVNGSHDAEVIDCETGDATPAQAAAWAKTQIGKGLKPTIYCNLSTWPDVKAEVANLGITVSYWIAHYDGICDVPAGAVAKQYQERKDQNLDYSAVANHWPGVDPEPVAKPAYVPPKGDSPSKHPWPLDGDVIHVGNSHPAVDTMARYLHETPDPHHTLTPHLAQVLAHWQDRMHLATHPAGILNRATWEAMK